MVGKLYKRVKSILFADPERLFKDEREIVNRPFYFPGENRKAVLLIHGWTAVPYELRRLGKFLNENGYTARGILLRGHGTVPKDLENVKWEDWEADVSRAYRELRENHEKVYVVGTSIGANLSVILAKNNPEIAGIVLMAMPYKIRLEKTVLFFAKMMSLFKNYNKKFYPPTFGAAGTITRVISYQTYPIKNVFEAFGLVKASRKVIPRISQPVFILQSASDHIAAKKSLEMIFEKVSSKVKRKKYVKRAYHTFISDIKNEHVFEDILGFLEEN